MEAPFVEGWGVVHGLTPGFVKLVLVLIDCERAILRSQHVWKADTAKKTCGKRKMEDGTRAQFHNSPFYL